MPPGFTNLTLLLLPNNPLTQILLPSDLSRLEFLNLGGTLLTSLELPAGLNHLTELVLTASQTTSLTLPPDMTQLVKLDLAGTPLATLVISEPMATNLAETVAAVQNQGVSVYTYPLTVELIRIREPIGAFQFAIDGPPGIYSVLGSTNLAVWSVVGNASNGLGKVVFTDRDGSPLFKQVLPGAAGRSAHEHGVRPAVHSQWAVRKRT